VAVVTFPLMNSILSKAMQTRSRTVTLLSSLTTHQAILLCVCARAAKSGVLPAGSAVREVWLAMNCVCMNVLGLNMSVSLST